MIRGWCPSLHEPMSSGDGLLVRVKPPLGRLPADAARALASAALAHGNGLIELTGRGALQFRGLTPASALRFGEIVVGLGLAHADPAVERRRSILVSPIADEATVGLAQALEAAIVGDQALVALPAKFGFAVDGSRVLPLGGGADVSLVVAGERCMIVPDGAGQAAVVDAAEAVPAVLRMAHAFLALAGSERRMRSVGRRVFAAAGLTPVPFELPAPRLAIGPVQGMFGVGLPFGAMDAATLAALAGYGVLQMTPWRAVLLPGAPDPAALAALGLIVSPDDPLLRISACPGEPGCASSTVITRDLARHLRPAPGLDIHVSGCSKGCAHPASAALTLVGREGRFDVVRRGRAGDIPVQRGLTPAEVMRLQ